MSNTIPDTIEVTIYFHLSKYSNGKVDAMCTDMSKYGYILLGTETVVLSVPKTDPVEAEMNMLEACAEEVRDEYFRKITPIEQRIRELTAIEHKPEDSDSE
jgi:hypothetical protein